MFVQQGTTSAISCIDLQKTAPLGTEHPTEPPSDQRQGMAFHATNTTCWQQPFRRHEGLCIEMFRALKGLPEYFRQAALLRITEFLSGGDPGLPDR